MDEAPIRYWCTILSTEGHKQCRKPQYCGCPCHLPGDCKPEARWRKRLGRPCDKSQGWVAGVRS
jgi:hypothetical protein